MWMLLLISVVVSPTMASILMPHTYYSSPRSFLDNLEATRPIEVQPVRSVEIGESSKESPAVVTQHNRNCFFTPVQCMLPLADTHKDVQTLHEVYQPAQVRRSAPWSFQKRTEIPASRFFQWLSR